LGESKKFHPYYLGPYLIKDQRGVNVSITPLQDDKLKDQCVHQNRLKRSYSVTQSKNPKMTLQLNEEMDTSEDYESSDEDVEWINLPAQTTEIIPAPVSPTSATTPTVPVNKRAPPEPLETIIEEQLERPQAEPVPAPSPARPVPVLLGAREDIVVAEDPQDKTYHPGRKIPEQPRRQNPQRTRRPPQRYSDSEFEVNGITVDTKVSYTTRTEEGSKKQEKILSIKQRAKHPKKRRMTPSSTETMSSQRQAFLCSVLLVMMAQKVGSAHVINSTEDLGKIFGPAQVCGSAGHHGMYIALPDKPSCEFVDSRSKIIEKVLVTPFFPLTFSEPIDAYSCQVEILSTKTFKGFWGTKSVLNRAIDMRALNLIDCIMEVNKIKSKTSDFKEIGHGIFTNDSSPLVDEYYWCCKDHLIQRFRMIIKKFTIRFNFHNGKIISSGFQTDECTLGHLFCLLPTATIMWEKNITESCSVREGTHVPATRTWDKESNTWTMVSEIGQLAVSGGLTVIE
jgi:hypothetical protein